MTEVEWSRVDGMVIAPDLDPMKLAQELKDRSIVAQIEWYEQTPELVGMRIATDGEHVGTLTKRGKIIHPGPPIAEITEELANLFKAEVMIGDSSFDAVPGDRSELVTEPVVDTSDSPVRTVEIGRSPASAVPLMAAFEGVDIAERDFPEGKRILAAQLPRYRNGWYFGDVPLVTLSMDGDEFQAVFVPDDDPENAITYNWGMRELTIAGAQGWESSISEAVHSLVGALPDIQAIHDAVPGLNVEEAFAASQMRGPEAVYKFVDSLALTSDIAEFLLGRRSLEQLSGFTIHRARGISNAIGRSVDILIDERQDGSKFWNTYTDLVTTKSWLIPAITGVEAATGIGLLILGRPRHGSRSVLGKTATVFGSMMLIDSFAQNALAKYMERKAHRRSQKENLLRP